MRCPKCGAFMEDGKDTCLMCGVNVKTYIPETNPNALFSSSNSSAFGSGNDFRTGAPTGAFNGMMSNQGPQFNRGNMQNNNNMVRKDSYKNAPFAPLSNEDKDIFDRYAENKGLFNTIFVFILFAIIGFAGLMYYNSRVKEVTLEPVIQALYFEVDDSFSKSGSNGSNAASVAYAKTNSQGVDCQIVITVGTNASNNHVDSFYKEVTEEIEPPRNSNNEVINVLDKYTPSSGEATINGFSWHFFNMFYKKTIDSEPIELRNRYLTSMYKSFYYDIKLLNYKNDATCAASLDNFAKSLRFIDS